MLLNQLEKRYARLLGQYEVAEQAVEPVYGLHAVLEKWVEIESTKKLLKRQMDQIAGTLRQFEPTWESERVRPIHPRGPSRGPGIISRVALAFMRTEKRPLSGREISRGVARRLKMVDPTERDIARIESAVIGTLTKRLGKTISCEGEKPRRWSLVSADRVVAGARSASDHAAANSPSSFVRSAA